MSSTAETVWSASGKTSKYDIPVSHLDFDYIKNCKDTKELEKIYITLKSGDEGYYPELQQTCEDRLQELSPNSRILRKENPVATKADVDHNEWQELDKDLKDWSSDMKYMEESLKTSQNAPDNTEEDLPPVRSGAITLTSQGAKTSNPSTKKPAKPREYRDWDKIDVDKELEKIDEGDKPKGRSFVDGKEVKDIPVHVDGKGLTESEKLMKANREKDKGNEAFKAGDYKEAIIYYSRSISLQPIAASYNNRALVYLKTEDWMKALTDTDMVLKLEPENVKALLRQATARKGLKQFDKAKKDLEKVLEKEPNNKRAQDLLQEVEKERHEKKKKGRRMVIEDVEGSDEENEKSNVMDRLADKNKESNMNEKSARKKTIEEVNGGNGLVNGHAEQSELNAKKDPKTLVNSDVDHAGGDSDKSKDIWSEEDLNEQIPGIASGKGDIVNKNGAKRHEKTEKTIDMSSDISSETIETKLEKVSKDSSKNEEVKENKNEIKVNSKLAEQTSTDSEENNACDGDDENENEDSEDKNPGDGDEENESSETSKITCIEDLDKSEPVTLKRPVFYQKPFPDSCIKLREEANTLFKNGQYGDAITIYTKLINILEHVDDQTVNLSLIYSNRAACQLKTGDLAGTVRDCTRSLQLIPHSVKPLIRRAMAYEHLERPRLAYIDYRHVLLLDGRIDQAHFGTKRCQELLHQKDGPKWREKFELPSVAWWEIPEIIDVEGKPTSQVVFVNPVRTAQQTCSASQSAPAGQQKDSPREVKDKPKEMSASEKYEKFKAEGNDFVKKVQFSEAVTCYNKCMELIPDQVAIYTNRALCYIKLNKPFEAEEDCTYALSLEKDNVKALFRRAQARKMLGKNREGIEDLNQLLKIDPKNTAAKKEMEVLKKHWREALDKLKDEMPGQTKGKSESKQRKRMIIEEVDSDEDSKGASKKGSSLKSKQTTEKPKVEESTNSKDTKQSTGSKVHKEPDRKATGSDKDKQPDRKPSSNASGSQDSKKSKKKSQIKETSTGLPNVQPSVPKLEKATPYEFISAWNALKKSVSLQPYYDLLQQIPSKDLPSVISNKLDGPMLNVMTRCVADYYLPKGEMDGAYKLLESLSHVTRFGTVAMFLSKEEQTRMKSVLDKLASHTSGVYSTDDLQKLKKSYSIK